MALTWYDIRQDAVGNFDHWMSNFEYLQTWPFLPKTTAQRTAFTQQVGLTVYDTDLKAVFASDGYNWIQIG